MMKVYICPQCGWVREVSRRKEVECHKCGLPQMTLTDMLYENFIELNKEERQAFADQWMKEHGKVE